MNVKTVKPFLDKKEGVTRKLGDAFTVSVERFGEINSTQFGVLVKAVTEEAAKPKSRKKPEK